MLTTASSSADTFVEAPNPVASEGAVIWTGARTGRIWKKVDRNGLRKEGELLSISNARSFTSGLQSYWQLTTEEVKGTSTAAAWAEQHTASSSPSQTPIDQSEMGRNPCEERRGAAEETKAAEKANADDEAKRKWMHLGYDHGKKVGVWKKQYWQEDRAEDRHNSQNCEESGIDWAAHSDSESKSVREAGAGTAAEESKAAADPNRTKGFAKAEPDRRCNHWGEQWGRRNWWQKEWQEGFSGWAGDFEWTGHPDSDPDSVRWNFAGSHVQLGSAETASLHAGWQSMEVAQHDEAAAAKMAETMAAEAPIEVPNSSSSALLSNDFVAPADNAVARDEHESEEGDAATASLHAGLQSMQDAQLARNRCADAKLHYHNAIRHLQIAVCKGVGSVQFEALMCRACAHSWLEEWEEALEDALVCTALDATSYRGFQVLGLARLEAGDSEGAACAYHRAHKLILDCPSLATEKQEIISGRDAANNARMRALPRLSGKTRTASVTNWSLQNVWERSHASTAADAITTRQFTMLHKTEMWRGGRLPYLLTVPAVHSAGHPEGHKFPLLVYLHSAGPVSRSKGDYEVAQMGLVAGEAPHSCVIESGQAGTVDNFIAISPCCPPNVTVFGTQHGRDWVPKKVAIKKKNYWFKTCDENAYHGWEFTGCYRCVEVELATIELIAHVCKILPVDPRRIYFYGVSAGGYGALRLGELLCDLPAAIVPIAGYYPDMPDRGHCTETMAQRLQRIPHVWPMHCKSDKLCNVESPHVSKAYGRLHDRGIFVDWIEGSISKGSNKNYHSPHQKILKDPNAFFNKLLDHTKANVEDPVVYLHRRIAELQMALTAA